MARLSGGTAMDILSLTEGRRIQGWHKSTDAQKLKIQKLYDQGTDTLKADQAENQKWNETLIKPADMRSGDLGGHNAIQKKNVIAMQRALAVSAQAGAVDYNIFPPSEDPNPKWVHADGRRPPGPDGAARAEVWGKQRQAGTMNILNVKAGLKKSPSAPQEYDWRYSGEDYRSGQYADKLKHSVDASMKFNRLQDQIKMAAQKERKDRVKRAEDNLKLFSKPVDAVVEPGTFLQEWLNEYGRPKRIPKKEENFLTYNSGPVGIVKSSSSKTTRKRDELAQTSLDLLGNSITGMPRTVLSSQRADEPVVKFETTRSNANVYRKGRLTN